VSHRAADANLLNLIHENTLQNGQRSPWLEAWTESLLPQLEYEYSLPSRPPGSEQFIKAASDSADSAIKRNLTYDRHAVETWNDFIQRVFEERWVEPLAHLMHSENAKEKSSTPRWTVEIFCGLIKAVVENLNRIGYELEAPTFDRLKELWNHIEKGKGRFRHIDW
jgi:hypothetical protein